jgi:S1-C subfamily serine protease
MGILVNRRWVGVAAGLVVIATVACASGSSLLQDQAATVEPVATRFAPPATPQADAGIALAPPVSEGDLVSLYQTVNPGVVAIRAITSAGESQGTGFVIDTDGHIVTNAHVVLDADTIEIDFPSGLKVWAELVGTESNSDLAVLHVDVPAGELVPLPLGDSSQLSVGQFVVAIGNPFGLSGTMTVGIISGLGRTLDSERAAPGGGLFSSGDIIQTDAAINPGNSGGPLVNLHGEVVGVNRAIRTETFTVTGDAANSGVGFAIPVNLVRRVITGLIEDGEFEYPYLGISSVGELDLAAVEALGLPVTTGAYVTDVTPGSPADVAGVRGAGVGADSTLVPRGGDLITAIDGHPVRQFSDLLTYLVNNTEVGQVVTLTVLRDGEEVELQLTIGARP